jgi:hypothetical protein
MMHGNDAKRFLALTYVVLALAGCGGGGGAGGASPTADASIRTVDAAAADAGLGGAGGSAMGGAGGEAGPGGAGGTASPGGGAGGEGGAGGSAMGGAGGEGGSAMGGAGGEGGSAMGGDGGSGGSEAGGGGSGGSAMGGAGGGGAGMGGAGGEGGFGGAGGGPEMGGDVPGPCGGEVGPGCPDGSYCDRGGQCAGEGVCTPVPEVCRDVDAPVCGCDGQTYDNACLAARAGVSVGSDGPCRAAVQRCDAGNACAAGTFCDYGASCGDGGLAGVCAPVPEVCRDVDAPVCGCDGQTYDNACLAAVAGVSVVADGPCRAMTARRCGGAADLSCGRGEYCDLGDQCGRDARRGTCEPLPQSCRAVDDPVCGCDGRTYDSPCLAARAGVTVASDGPCRAR